MNSKNVKELKSCKERLLKKEKYIMLYEAMILQKKYYGMETFNFHNSERAFEHNLYTQLTSRLFNELFDDLVANDFIVDLKNERDETLDKATREEEQQNTKNMSIIEMDNIHSNIYDTYNYMNYEFKIKSLDMIMVMLETKQYDKLFKIIVSDKIEKSQKIAIIKKIIENAPRNLEEIFTSVPDDYHFYGRDMDYRDYFKALINNNLLILNDEKEYIETKIRSAIKDTQYIDCETRFNVRQFIKFFIDHNLVDINEINWDYKGLKVSSACAGYITRNDELGKYLYNLPSYRNIDKDIRKDSDMALMKYFLTNRHDIFEFITLINFEATPEKLRYLESLILKAQTTNLNFIKDKDIKKIVDCFLKKTKKVYYKEMQKAIISLQTNSDPEMLKKARANFTKALQNICNPLLEQVPAKSNVADAVKTIKKNS
jgi:hypothetical protein